MTTAQTGSDEGSEKPLPPGPGGLPLLGCTLSLVRDPLDFMDTAVEYGDIVSYTAFGKRFVGIGDPDIVERVLVSENEAFKKGGYQQQFGELIAPEGVVFTEGERWRRQRQLLQSEFTPREIQSYADEMVAETVVLAEEWTDGDIIELRETMSTLTLRILTQTLFDLDFDAERGEIVRDAVSALSEYIGSYPLLMLLPSWVPSRSERRYNRAMDELNGLVDTLVAERRRSEETADDLLSMLADAEYPDGEQMSSQEVRDQLVTFLFAGHETTATALTFTCWLLAGDTRAEERLKAEVESVCAEKPAFTDIPDLEFTEAVVREALRLYPPLTDLYREPTETTTLGGYEVPKDATVMLSTYRLHRHEEYWDDPETFRPERWLPEIRGEDPGRPEYAYFPFGGGPRHCLGMRFAMTELQLILATLVQRVSLERVTDTLDLSLFALTLDPGSVEVQIRKG